MPRLGTIARTTAAALALAASFLPAVVSAQATAQPPAAPAASAALPSTAAAALPPASAALRAPDPQPGETNAQRALTQPGNNAPFWRAVRDSGQQRGVSNLPGAEKGVLVQEFVNYPGVRTNNAGEAWRQVRNRWILPYGGSLLLIVLLALAIFYFARGPLGGHVAYTGRLIERFTPLERAVHWTNAAAFVALAVSGIVMAFGKFFLLPVMGRTLFGALSYVLKTLHNFVGPLFAVSLVMMIVLFLRSNLPQRGDLRWVLRGGGMFGGGEVPSHRFNAGEKFVFWIGVTLAGVVVAGSGMVLDKLLPGLGYLRGDMQVAHMVHAVAAVVMMAILAGHAYLGSIGMRHSYRAMRTGYVDEGWAREHHALWAEDVRAGRIPAKRSNEPLPGSVPASPSANTPTLAPLGVVGAAPRA